MTPAPIGILACSSEGASLCFRTICQEAPRLLGAHAHPEISMHAHSLADYVRCLDAEDTDGVADLMADSVDKLRAAGARVIVCPDNTIHRAYARAARRSDVRWPHIAEVVADAAREGGYRRVGLLGTRWLMDSPVYDVPLAECGIACVRPAPQAGEEVSRIIMDELVQGHFRPASVDFLADTIDGLRDRGCDAVILGCTELPLVITDAGSPLPVLDSTRLLARAGLRESIRLGSPARVPSST